MAGKFALGGALFAALIMWLASGGKTPAENIVPQAVGQPAGTMAATAPQS